MGRTPKEASEGGRRQAMVVALVIVLARLLKITRFSFVRFEGCGCMILIT